MQGLRFDRTGAPIQVGSMSGAVTSDAAITVSGVIEIAEVTGAGVWVAYGSSAPSANDAGAFFIPPYGVTRPFLVATGQTQVRSSGTNINVREL
tara:strand:- start:1321 stop:1602 length:282 start_codon:yes stop_codon:yes gene_type:complete